MASEEEGQMSEKIVVPEDNFDNVRRIVSMKRWASSDDEPTTQQQRNEGICEVVHCVPAADYYRLLEAYRSAKEAK